MYEFKQSPGLLDRIYRDSLYASIASNWYSLVCPLEMLKYLNHEAYVLFFDFFAGLIHKFQLLFVFLIKNYARCLTLTKHG